MYACFKKSDTMQSMEIELMTKHKKLRASKVT